MNRNPPITAYEHDLLTPLSQTFLFSKRPSAVIDSSEKCNDWLNLELQSPLVIERRSNIYKTLCFLVDFKTVQTLLSFETQKVLKKETFFPCFHKVIATTSRERSPLRRRYNCCSFILSGHFVRPTYF